MGRSAGLIVGLLQMAIIDHRLGKVRGFFFEGGAEWESWLRYWQCGHATRFTRDTHVGAEVAPGRKGKFAE